MSKIAFSPTRAAIGFAAAIGISMTAALLWGRGIISAEAAGFLFLLSAMPGLILSFRYWGKLDEPSKEAHKFAFIWGWGLAAATVSVASMSMLFFPALRDLVQGWVESWIAFSRGKVGDEEGAVGAYLAIYVCGIVQFLAYALVWLGWWARQRMGTTAN